ncbi:hypothetical protein [uncultured Reyranella sp.]|jgi:hypothetical protein|uniref:hypothetical protein n=1 Tax=uncultured Reyranella sp. TaxID=735512 RepID=UPI00259D23BC|nr:hypothetical protein [uncultured Reyranella sp.]
MFILGLVLALAGIAGAAWWLAVGPMIWAPFAFVVFLFGCLICALASVRYAVEKGSEQIVQAINRKPAAPSPAETFAAPRPRPAERDVPSDVAPTPHPERRRPSFEELTGRKSD